MLMAMLWCSLFTAQAQTAQADFDAHCASCHGAARYGGYSPPLLPDSLKRKTDDQLIEVIMNGRPNTQMPPFSKVLGPLRAAQLVALMRTDSGDVRWGESEIAESRVQMTPDGPPLPPHVRRDNLTLVVERGSASVVVLDGDSMQELDRFEVGRVHGGPKFDQALRHIWAVTRDGTVVAYDLDAGGPIAKVKAAINTRNIAVNASGDLVATAAQLPAHVAIFDGALRVKAVLPLQGQPSGIYQEPGAERFVLTLRDRPELIFIDQATLKMQVQTLPEPFEDFVFVPGRRQLLASSRKGARVHLYDLDSNKVVATLQTEALPHLFSACFFERDGALHAAINHIGAPKLTVVQVDGLVVKAEIPLVGSGYFARTHPGTPYIWVDTNTETIQLVDKSTLTVHGPGLTPAPGKKAMHVEFTADGGRALVSVWDPQGAVVIYDATTAQELERKPYNMPIGKYNAHNKTKDLWRAE